MPSKARPVAGAGRGGLLCDPGSELQLIVGREKKKQGEDNTWDERKNQEKKRRGRRTHTTKSWRWKHLVEISHRQHCSAFRPRLRCRANQLEKSSKGVWMRYIACYTIPGGVFHYHLAEGRSTTNPPAPDWPPVLPPPAPPAVGALREAGGMPGRDLLDRFLSLFEPWPIRRAAIGVSRGGEKNTEG